MTGDEIMQTPAPLFLAGPTATGKSEVGLLLAEKLGGEIVSVDSMQVYRGMDIGTAKPLQADRARVPHHLIDVADISESFDAGRFLQLAKESVRDIQQRGHVPILCGGTGLYFKAFLDGLGTAPAEPHIRAELERVSLPELLRELAQKDPATYARIDKQNSRRVFRALEVIRVTGKPYSEQRADWSHTAKAEHNTWVKFGLFRTPEDLRQRIELRVDGMFSSGLVEETRQLLEKGLAGNRTAMQALGYRQVIDYLSGALSLEKTTELVKTKTRQFAKRQMTWFRRQLSMTWVEATPTTTAEELSDEILAGYRAASSST